MWFDFFRRRVSPADRVARVLGADRVLVSDGERVASAGDYVGVVEELCALTGGALQFDEIACASRHGMRELSLRRGPRAWRAALEDDTDWVDTDALLLALNDALEDLALEQRFTTFEADAGQATGYAWCTAEEARALRGEPHWLDVAWTPFARTGWKPTPLHAHLTPNQVLGLAASPDGRIVASCAGNEILRFDLAAMTELDPIPLDHPKALAWDSDGTLLVGTQRGLLSGDRRLGYRVVLGISLDRTARRAAVAAIEHPDLDPPGFVELWDLPTGDRLGEWPFDVGNLAVAISPDGERVAAVTETGRMGLWTTDGITIGEREWDGPLWGVAFRPDSTELAVGPESGPVARVSALTAGVVSAVTQLRATSALAWGPDGTLAVGSGHGIHLVRDGVRDAAVEHAWAVGRGEPAVTALAWLPDGSLVGATSPVRGRAQIWRWRR